MGLATKIAESVRIGSRSDRAGRRMQAVWKGAVLAESDRTIRLEGNHYFPLESVRREYFVESDSKSVCPWKGIASYYSVEVEGQRNDDAAWTYRNPSPLARKIKDHVAFCQGVEVVEAE